ncbi:MAG: glycosyltransferase [Lachnospiraceae bacterium]|nr:glycosyltransferase [Lachnospiraceae bacterium]
MKLSVIVPVYNMVAGNKLQFCLDSLVNQTITDYEIIAVDDASTDRSKEVLMEYQARYPHLFKVLSHEVNKRQGGAKNTGLREATGEWIGFIDSDDWISPDYYEKLLKKAEETDADMVGCDYNLVYNQTFEVGEIVQNNSMDQTGVLDNEKHKKLIMRSGSMVIKIYKHQIIRDNHLAFPEGIFYEDNCAGPVWSLYFTHFEKVEEPLYYYYQHNSSTVHYITVQKCKDRMVAASMFLQECNDRGFMEKYLKEIEYRFTELYFVNTLFSYMLGAKNRKLSFVESLKQGMWQAFPNFQQNEYYQKLTNEEEKQMIALLEKSTIKFFNYYGLKVWVRKVRKKLKI